MLITGGGFAAHNSYTIVNVPHHHSFSINTDDSLNPKLSAAPTTSSDSSTNIPDQINTESLLMTRTLCPNSGADSVSYKHLDVYKRQVLTYSAPFIRPS
ncbi:hypothetical protein, partial [Treponema sp. R8-4-B8]